MSSKFLLIFFISFYFSQTIAKFVLIENIIETDDACLKGSCTTQTEAKSESKSWSYDDPSQWSRDFPVCNGQRQSPINIKTRKVKWVASGNAIGFTNYSNPIIGTFENNGHALQFNPDDSSNSPPRLFGKLLGDNTYQLAQVHFHWGSKNSRGSEHTIDKHRFSMEMHMVHINEKYAETPAEAGKNKDGYAVVGIFLNVNGYKPNFAFEEVTKGAQSLSRRIEHQSTLSLGDFLDQISESNGFFYEGSLTTPGCNEAVSWIVFETPIEISEDQITPFRRLFQDDGWPLVDNYRPVQPLNNRVVQGFYDWLSN